MSLEMTAPVEDGHHVTGVVSHMLNDPVGSVQNLAESRDIKLRDHAAT